MPVKTQAHSNDLSNTRKSDYEKATLIDLRVAPFPYVPDSVGDQYKSLFQFIIDEFQSIHPNIRLHLRPFNISDGFYAMSTLTQWLGSNGPEYDVVEVDTVMLGDLVNAGLIAPQRPTLKQVFDWHSAAATSIEFNQAAYAYPHLMCATFLFTRDDKTAQVSTIDQLIDVLGSKATVNYRLVGNLDSSWVLPSRLIHCFQDSNDPQSNNAAFALHGYEHSSFECVRKLARLCDRIRGENHCLDGTFDQNSDMPALLFANKQADSMFAYSEQLSTILKNGAHDDYNKIKLIPFPAGTLHNQPLFAVDAYVFRRNMSDDVLNAAQAFVEFMATPRMQAAVVATGDDTNGSSVPRYLLPISKKAYDESLLIHNRFYQDFFRNLTGYPLPNTGFFNTRKEIQRTLLNYIQ
ncbi:unnamed protein product [Rotaria sp. Silwood2]|nr:unnamed protein product [Rotaria sp. Silwood2]CAF2991443.1 unnamed protein product [Rotaria sp. Silwood2]CAF3303291.1 unnamed protein product [Rotaria sp. Silwood2]CAF3354794.1 unnamed protein product [Rotaria sp. Silwood2]CAF3908804.1 unnamed protein product [Rotaria sp. Silwood2]